MRGKITMNFALRVELSTNGKTPYTSARVMWVRPRRCEPTRVRRWLRPTILLSFDVSASSALPLRESDHVFRRHVFVRLPHEKIAKNLCVKVCWKQPTSFLPPPANCGRLHGSHD